MRIIHIQNCNHNEQFLLNFKGTTFKYPEARSKSFEYTDTNVVVGSLVMSSNGSIRALEFENEKEHKERGEIETKLAKMEEDRRHLEVLEAAIVEWNDLLKNIQRLSKGVPLMRSIRLVRTNEISKHLYLLYLIMDNSDTVVVIPEMPMISTCSKPRS